MQSSLTIISPAESTALVTLYEARLALGLGTSADPMLDDQLGIMIEWSSAEIAVLCNRTFAKEKVKEIFYNIDSGSNRLYLSHYPVTNIESVYEDGNLVDPSDYDLDADTGTLIRLDGEWSGTTVIIYTGGYDLPNKSPKSLRNAALLMTREAYFATTRGDASIRMVAHNGSRVMYFDPNAKNASGVSTGGGGSAARRAVGDLLKHFMRFWV